MKILSNIDDAFPLLREGGVIAYPTEAVYGLGCDPFNQQAVQKIIHLKQRPIHKGMIILISNWQQLSPLIEELPEELMRPVRKTWPGPITWVFPKSDDIPSWICGDHGSIAIRMSLHPVASYLCQYGPIVSTSANISAMPPAKDLDALSKQFPGGGIDAVIAGELGKAAQPSAIYDVLTGSRLR